MKIGALWLREPREPGEDGKKRKFFSGEIDLVTHKVPIVVFRNTDKKTENHPDYIIKKSTPRKDSADDHHPPIEDDLPF